MIIYKVTFEEDAKEMRTRYLSLIEGVDILVVTEDGNIIFSCEDEAVEAVEYELRKAKRNDGYCKIEKI